MIKHKGFVLVPILIITTISAMLAFAQLSDNRLQERVAGNQQKEISARLAAEKGIFKAFNDIKVQSDLGQTNDQIISALIDSGKVDLSARESYSFPSDNNGASPEATIITLVSKGEFSGATAYLKAVIKTIDGPGGLGKTVSYCSIYYYYPQQDTAVAALDSGYSEYCGVSAVVAAEPFCGYVQRSFDDQYSEYKGAAEEARIAVETAALAASTAVALAASEAVRIAGLTAGEATIATAEVAYQAARMTRCTAYAAGAETRWAGVAYAAQTVAVTVATALAVAEAANATDAEKIATLAIVTAAAIAAAAPWKAVHIAATAAAVAVDVAALAAHNAVVTAAAAAIEIAGITDAVAKADRVADVAAALVLYNAAVADALTAKNAETAAAAAAAEVLRVETAAAVLAQVAADAAAALAAG
ncbi:ferredoxin-type 4Fe-4S protein [Psychromonas ingrahamii 37]|uniref:Ferredoxin-type 4Fe-4S protein n=1 Tax=Psychromonas ingrahamii (strain DSM 17664 / CCUG 51855 / 37) TaxID=357804 RepID=A1SZM1_PSYIN|nr:ferredoxin-type 4Fe-4S protein [Psychromonas ingrahamii]ABM04936.1 ferredoxin-type 4Fe-4S protein [Psychromonas ingrahamii 37]